MSGYANKRSDEREKFQDMFNKIKLGKEFLQGVKLVLDGVYMWVLLLSSCTYVNVFIVLEDIIRQLKT